MSACPACRAVSSIRWSSTHRGVQTRPAGIHGTPGLGRGQGCTEVVEAVHDLLGQAGRSSARAMTSARVSPSTSRKPSVVVVSGNEQPRIARRDVVDPGPLDQGGVLDQPSQAQLAEPGRAPRPLVVETVGGVAQGIPLLAEEGQQAAPLVGRRGLRVRAWCRSPFCRLCRRVLVCVAGSMRPIIWPPLATFCANLGSMRADRLVAALLVLQAKGRVTAAQLADELEVSERTARRDLEGLAMAGIPVYSQPGRDGGWELVGGARTDLSGLTADEARALFLLAGPAGGHPASAGGTAQTGAARCRPRSASTPRRQRARCARPAWWDHDGARRPRPPRGAPARSDRRRADRAGLPGSRRPHVAAHRPSARSRREEQHVVPRRRDRGGPEDVPSEPRPLGVADGPRPAERPADFDLAEAWHAIVTTSTPNGHRSPCGSAPTW